MESKAANMLADAGFAADYTETGSRKTKRQPAKQSNEIYTDDLVAPIKSVRRLDLKQIDDTLAKINKA